MSVVLAILVVVAAILYAALDKYPALKEISRLVLLAAAIALCFELAHVGPLVWSR